MSIFWEVQELGYRLASAIIKETVKGAVLSPREIMFPPLGQHTALVYYPVVSAAPFMVNLERG